MKLVNRWLQSSKITEDKNEEINEAHEKDESNKTEDHIVEIKETYEPLAQTQGAKTELSLHPSLPRG